MHFESRLPDKPGVEPLDFVVIGGGAAGFFGAIAFAESAPGSRVRILEKSGEVLTKVRISGGGRCNVTHACFEPKEFATRYPRGGGQLIGPLHRWGAAETVDWFERRGVALKTEEDGRMFPVTDDSGTVVECLTGAIREREIEVYTRCEAIALTPTESGWRLETRSGEPIDANAVLLATGGARSGGGVALAASLGHRIIPPVPSLFTFRTDDPLVDGLAGVSVANVVLRVEGTKLVTDGPCLVTHQGLSGPAVLKLSAWGARELAERQYDFELTVNWCGGRRREEIEEVLTRARETVGRRRVSSFLEEIPLPKRLWRRLCQESGVEREATWSNLPRTAARELASRLCERRFRVHGKSTYREEFVTAGGVALEEVDFRTMESRRCPGLHFAGEVLDIDGVTGGFNFQAAWTTGRIAGEQAAARLGEART